MSPGIKDGLWPGSTCRRRDSGEVVVVDRQENIRETEPMSEKGKRKLLSSNHFLLRVTLAAWLFGLLTVPAGFAQDLPIDGGAENAPDGDLKLSDIKLPSPEEEIEKLRARLAAPIVARTIDGKTVHTINGQEVNICVAAIWKRGPNLFVYFRNPTREVLEVAKLEVNGVVLPYPPGGGDTEIRSLLTTGILWCDLLPDPVPPGGLAELKIRVNDTVLPLVSDTLVLRLQSKGGQVYEGSCPMLGAPRFRLKSYAFDKKFATLHLYFHGKNLAEVTKVMVENDDLTANTTVRRVADTDCFYLKVSLPRPVAWGEYKAVTVVTNLGLNMIAVKAIIPLFPIQLWGVGADGRPPTDKLMGDCARHGINSFSSGCFLWGGPKALPLLSKYGLRAAGNRWSTTPHWGWASLLERCQELGDDERLLCWDIVDEPTGGRYKAINPQVFQSHWLLPYRKYTRQPSYISNTWYGDQGLFDYADMHGVFMYCAYGGQRGIPGLIRSLRARVGHKPVVYILQAYRRHGGPLPHPENERYMVHLAVAHGAKGISYFIHSPGWGLGGGEPETKVLWEGIGQINRELGLIGPLLWRGEPVPLAVADNEKVEVAAILSGEDTMLLIVLNHNWALVSHPVENCRVEVKLPDWFKIEGLFQVTYKGLSKLQYQQGDRQMAFSLKQVQTSAVLVLTGDKQLFSRMAGRLSSAGARQSDGDHK